MLSIKSSRHFVILPQDRRGQRTAAGCLANPPMKDWAPPSQAGASARLINAPSIDVSDHAMRGLRDCLRPGMSAVVDRRASLLIDAEPLEQRPDATHDGATAQWMNAPTRKTAGGFLVFSIARKASTPKT